ncbi:Alpha/Beta hydrolase protein [Neocallimastix lanati (nom. inval.)]|nr:Alpha/Beta hydrolase protein [Neocallimastix sp. JGI-2020a]
MASIESKKKDSLSSTSTSFSSDTTVSKTKKTNVVQEEPKKKGFPYGIVIGLIILIAIIVVLIFNFWIIIGIIGIIIIFVIILAIWNAISISKDKKILEEYEKTHCKKMEVDGHQMNYGMAGKNNTTTIIILPGFSLTSPIIEFKSLSDNLSDKYRIVIPEALGYGFSDTTDKERTPENIVSELHEVIGKLGIKNYYLMAHSFGGIYCLEWANQYPNEVLGFIGIDVSVPKQITLPELKNDCKMITKFCGLMNFLKALGILRFLYTIKREKAIPTIDPNHKNYTKEDIDTVIRIALTRSYNKTVAKEGNYIPKTLVEMCDKKFPENVPVLNFVKIRSPDGNIYKPWVDIHHEVITNTTHSEVVELDGDHILHVCFKNEIVNKIKEWIP